MADDTGAVEYLAVEDLVALARMLLGDPPGIRDMGLLGSAAARPETTAFGADAYSELWTKTAALLQSVVNNHALVDGNKRLGWLATAVFLEINGVPVVHASNDGVYNLVFGVAAGRESVDDIAAALRLLIGGADPQGRPGVGRRGGARGVTRSSRAGSGARSGMLTFDQHG